MKKKLLCVLLALCFAFACQTAFAVSFSREEYRQIVFEAIGGASDANDKLCDNLWLGTVEAPGLGTAYLYTFVDVYEGKTQGFLYLYGDEAYLAYTGELALQPCGACVLPQGNWSIRFQSGRPVLMLNGSDKAKIEGVKISSFPFSIPVVDQYGDPVEGAVFGIGIDLNNSLFFMYLKNSSPIMRGIRMSEIMRSGTLPSLSHSIALMGSSK